MAQHVENVEEVLTICVKRCVVDNEVDVEVDVAPIEGISARQPVIDTVWIDEPLVPAIRATVIVDHADIAFVDILGCEEEAMVVEPHAALQLSEISGHKRQAAIPVRT